MPFRADSPNVGLEVVKRAEKADAWILRLVERCGESGEVVLTLPPGRAFKVCETDLLEWEALRPCAVADGRVSLRLKPFEIKTIRVDEIPVQA